MRLQHLDLNLLVALNALLTERSVAAAAVRVRLTPSAMSHALARLRQQFDDELLVAAGRKMVLTPRAQALIVPLRSVLEQIEDMVDTDQVFAPATSSRRFTLMASDYALGVVVADAIARMKAVAPRMSFDVQHPDVPVQRLVDGQVDLILQPRQHLAPDHPSALLFEDEYVIVAWSGSDVARHDIDLERYFALGHVAVSFGQRQRDGDAVDLAVPRARRIEVTTHSFAHVPQLLVGTELLATLPRRQAIRSASTVPLDIKPLPFAAPPIHECVQWNRSRATDAATLWVVAMLQAAALQPQVAGPASPISSRNTSSYAPGSSIDAT